MTEQREMRTLYFASYNNAHGLINSTKVLDNCAFSKHFRVLCKSNSNVTWNLSSIDLQKFPMEEVGCWRDGRGYNFPLFNKDTRDQYITITTY